jgi:two-component system NarL family sensor kinase
MFVTITGSVIFIMTLLIASLIYFYQKKKQLFQSSIEKLKLDHEKNLLQTRVEIQEQTFLDISREIHDNINLSLTLAKLNLNTLDWNDRAKAAVQVKGSVDILGTAIAHLNDLSKSMNPELISGIGLVAALETEVERIGKLGRLEIDLQFTGEIIFLAGEKELVIFRIIQEAFNNIIKHSGGNSVKLHLHYETDYVEIWIKDNGRGFEKECAAHRKGHAGLTNMQTRAALFGGSFLVESRKNKGTQLLIKIPT